MRSFRQFKTVKKEADNPQFQFGGLQPAAASLASLISNLEPTQRNPSPRQARLSLDDERINQHDIQFEPCEDFFGLPNMQTQLVESSPSIVAMTKNKFYHQLSGLSVHQDYLQQITASRKSSGQLASYLRPQTPFMNRLRDSSTGSLNRLQPQSPIHQLRLTQPSYMNFFGEGFNGYLDKIEPQTKNPTMSMESDQEMLQYVDDPTLFEFNQNHECESFDEYESLPAPMQWQPEDAGSPTPQITFASAITALPAQDSCMASETENTPRVRKNLVHKKVIRKNDQSSSYHTDATFGKPDSLMIGVLTVNERLQRVQRYLNKKRKIHDPKKFSYKCRKQVADKRLRIKGRFVTKEQAFQILGLSQEELLDNKSIQELLTQQHIDPIQLNSIITGQGCPIKIRNFQALIDKGYTHTKEDDANSDGESLQKSMTKLHLHMNSSGFEVLRNYVQPVFRICKVDRSNISI